MCTLYTVQPDLDNVHLDLLIFFFRTMKMAKTKTVDEKPKNLFFLDFGFHPILQRFAILLFRTSENGKKI